MATVVLEEPTQLFQCTPSHSVIREGRRKPLRSTECTDCGTAPHRVLVMMTPRVAEREAPCLATGISGEVEIVWLCLAKALPAGSTVLGAWNSNGSSS